MQNLSYFPASNKKSASAAASSRAKQQTPRAVLGPITRKCSLQPLPAANRSGFFPFTCSIPASKNRPREAISQRPSLAASHPLAGETGVSLERLLQERFILTEKGCNYRQVFESELAARGQSLECCTEIGYTPYIIQAVSSRLGIGLLPSITLKAALQQEKIALIPVENYQIRMSIQVIYSNKRRISLPLRAFLDTL